MLFNHAHFTVINIHACARGLAAEAATVEGVPLFTFHFLTSHFFNACAEGLVSTADGADFIDEGVLLGLERRGAPLALHGVSTLGCRVFYFVGMVMMVAGFYANLRAVPAHVLTFYRSGHALGAYHHHVADGQRAVVVAAFTRTDGAHAGLVASCFGDDGTAVDGDVATLATLSATDARAIVVALSIDIAAADDDDATVCILATTNTRSIHAEI